MYHSASRSWAGSFLSTGITRETSMQQPGTQRFAFDLLLFPYGHVILQDPQYGSRCRHLLGDLELLPGVLEAAERFASRPADTEMARLQTEHRLSSLSSELPDGPEPRQPCDT